MSRRPRSSPAALVTPVGIVVQTTQTREALDAVVAALASAASRRR